VGKTYSIDVVITKVDAKQAKARLKDIKDRTRNVRPVLKKAAEDLERVWGDNFTTMGLLSAKAMLKGGWKPLSPSYYAWKKIRYPATAEQILVQTGKLYTLVSNASSNPESDIDDQSMELVVPGRIARWHQFGTKNMPARPIVFVPRDFDRTIGKHLAKYIVEGSRVT
jgi:phage gpG-like protein